MSGKNGDSMPVTRRECDIEHDALETRIGTMEKVQGKWDNRFWALGTGIALNLAGIVGILIVALTK